MGSQLFGAPGESDAEAASVIASTVLEYVDGRNPVSVGPMNERERMDVMDDMIE